VSEDSVARAFDDRRARGTGEALGELLVERGDPVLRAPAKASSVVVAVSSGFARPEDLRLLAAAAAVSGVHLDGVVVTGADPGDAEPLGTVPWRAGATPAVAGPLVAALGQAAGDDVHGVRIPAAGTVAVGAATDE